MSFSPQRKRTLLVLTADVAAVAAAPILLVAGDSLLRWARDPRRLHGDSPLASDGRRTTGGTMTLPRGLVATNPIVVALGAPQRWIRDRLRHRNRPARPRWFPPGDEGPAGVREPRRPLPTPPGARLARPLPGDGAED